jgi:hypothetical protein
MASHAIFAAGALASDTLNRRLELDNSGSHPVDSGESTRDFNHHGALYDVGIGGRNTGTIALARGPAISLGSKTYVSNQILFTDITYRNLGALSTRAEFFFDSPAVDLGSFGRKGDNGGHHATHSGGPGHPGGVSGAISFSNLGLITVEQAPQGTLFPGQAPGVRAVSQGGAGGHGGSAGSSGHGGRGGRGGDGGAVTVTNEAGGAITTRGSASAGILALSRGGLGGDAGGGHVFAAGNNGGVGGNGAAVSVSNLGLITTFGVNSAGVSAISQGGGGGDGSGSGILRHGGGGEGGDGNAGGTAYGLNHGRIETQGAASPGLLVGSVGGNGGTGGSSKGLFVAVGATGGHGGNGAEATAGQFGQIITSGARAAGLHVQSVGGGGGRGGDAEAIGLEASVAVGGTGGGGGNGGRVTVDLGGGIVTTGRDAAGLMAQSVGGGGGAGGDSEAVTAGAVVATSFSVGGRGGEGGDGGTVMVKALAGSSIVTGTATMVTLPPASAAAPGDSAPQVPVIAGTHAYGILAQSVGGGGGHGGRAISYAFAAGGETPAGSLAFAMGGSGAVAGHGDAVKVENAGAITTHAGRADAIVAQSIGGGGGSGGNAITVSGAASPAGALAAGVGLGGHGGGGGNGGAVKVTNSGPLATLSSHAAGIVAQSVGGGGGNGGSVLGIEGSFGKNAINASVDLGGKGGHGGAAGKVKVTQTGSIVTFGHQSYGVLVQSVGGGGGNGGSVHDYSVTIAGGEGQNGGKTLNASVAIGGSGGKGGAGSHALLTHGGSIFTSGDHAHGALVQSIGGGGGSGGHVSTVSLTAAASQSADSAGKDSTPGAKALSAQVAVGGSGGSGGVGGRARFVGSSGASIRTEGAMADGVLVQSVGGGGGHGGQAHSLSVTTIVPTSGTDVLNSAKKGLLSKLFGPLAGGLQSSSGSEGGDADGDAETGDAPPPKPKPTGIQGTSLSLTADVGGKGGKGATGGSVDVRLASSFSIVTLGNHAHGVAAQSIGGGGGRGGAAHTDAISPIATYTGTATVGGKGGSGNYGGTVTVSDQPDGGAGSIVTGGQGSHGIFAQSVGGGGGDGGLTTESTQSVPLLGKKSLSVEVGGKEGSGGDGGAVSVVRGAPIQTYGDNAYGILAQSIGGGGGSGHFILTDNAPGVHKLTIGGQGGAGGHGGPVSVTGSGTITTQGAAAHAVVAQSVGGGGGTLATGQSVVSAEAQTGKHAKAALSFGNQGTSREGSGGAVTIGRQGSITTQGNHAYGLLAQTVGGGGGVHGAAQTSFEAGASGSIALVPQHTGAGGAVVVSDLPPVGSTASGGLAITTRGIGAHGIFAQSIGGGGGLAILDSDIAVPAIQRGTATDHHNGGANLAGAISVTSTGAIETFGNFAAGILVHSGSAGALLVATNQGYADSFGAIPAPHHNHAGLEPGSIAIAKTGALTTHGAAAHGIRVLSDSAAANGVTVAIGQAAGGRNATPDTTVATFGAGSSALAIRNGNRALYPDAWRSTLTSVVVAINPGASLDLSRNASAAFAVDIDNARGPTQLSVGGSVLGAATRAIDETRAAIRFESGGSIAILPGGLVQGAVVGPDIAANGPASLSVAGVLRGSVSRIASYGLQQGGTHFVPVDFQAGRKVVDVGAVTALAGTVTPYLTRFGQLSQASGQEYRLISAATPFRAGNVTVSNSLVTRYETGVLGESAAGISGLVLKSATVNFAAAPIDPALAPGAARADRLAAQWSSGAPVAVQDTELSQGLVDAANTNDPAVLNNALRALQPTSQAQTTTTVAKAATGHLGAMLSCGVAQGNFAAIQEGDCSWASATGSVSQSFIDRRTTHAASFVMGTQRAIDHNWRLGLGIGYDTSRFRSREMEGPGHRLHLGATAKYVSGPWLAALGLSASHGWGEETREVLVPDLRRQAKLDRQSSSGAARLRLARLFEFGMFNLTPMLDIDATYILDFGHRERGAGVWNTTTKASHSLLLDLHPALRIGRDLTLSNDVVLRPYIEAGLRYNTTNGTSKVRFHESAILTEEIAVKHRSERLVATFGAGLSIFPRDDLEVKLTYSGAVSEAGNSHGGTIKIGARF